MADLTSLIARLEGLTGPDREVDADIYIQFNIPAERVGRIDRSGGCVGWWPKDAPYESAIDVERYTGSLDAAVALTERVLPGHRIALTVHPNRAIVAQTEGDAWHVGDELDDAGACAGPTPAIALILATLKAKQAQEKTDE